MVALVFRETLGRAAETPSKDTVGLDAFLSCVGPARSSHGLESNSRVLIYVVWRTHAHTHTHTYAEQASRFHSNSIAFKLRALGTMPFLRFRHCPVFLF